MILYIRDYLLFGLFFLAVVLYLAQKQLTVNLNLQASKLDAIQQQFKAYQIQNNALNLQYLYDSSYQVIYQKAIKSGFIPVSKNSYIYL